MAPLRIETPHGIHGRITHGVTQSSNFRLWPKLLIPLLRIESLGRPKTEASGRLKVLTKDIIQQQTRNSRKEDQKKTQGYDLERGVRGERLRVKP